MERYRYCAKRKENVSEIMSFHNSIYTLRERLDKYSDLLPVFLLVLNAIWVLIVFVYRYKIEQSGRAYTGYELSKYDYIVRSFIEAQLPLLIIMFCKSKNYRRLSWFSYVWLLLWWCINEVYVIFDYEVDIYYTVLGWLIFPIFALLASMKLTNRC